MLHFFKLEKLLDSKLKTRDLWILFIIEERIKYIIENHPGLA